MESKNYPMEKESNDYLLEGSKVAFSMVPLVGAPTIELMNMLVTPKLQERRDKWLQDLGERVKKLEEEGKIDYQKLQEDDVFIDISIKATEVALKTSQEEKLQALKNTLINTALKIPSIDTSLKQIFVQYIDIFTVWHIKLLILFNNPKEYESLFPNIYTDWLKTIIEGVYPELKGKEDMYVAIWKDLYSKNLVNTDLLSTSMTKDGLFQRRTTKLGLNFLQFIEER